jgi:hypothetical protein
MKVLDREWLIEGLIFCGLLVLVLGCKLDTLRLPYYWDEKSAYVRPAHLLFVDGNLWHSLPGLHPPAMFFGHPFGLYVALAWLWRIFGERVVVSHVFIVLVSFAGVYYTYRVGRLLYGRPVGVIAAVLLFASPLVLAQSGMVTGDAVITALGPVVVYHYLRRQYVAFLAASILLVLTKETGAAIVASIAIYAFWERAGSSRWRAAAKHSVALAVLAMFFFAQLCATGNWLPNPQFLARGDLIDLQLDPLNKLGFVFSWTFVEQGRWVVLALLAARFALQRRQALRRELVLLGAITASSVLPYSFVFYMPRYTMSVLPFFFIVGAAAMVALFRWKSVYWGVAVATAVLFAQAIHPTGAPLVSGETDMHYADIVRVHRQAARYLAATAASRRILTDYPLVSDLQEPALGYVDQPLDTFGLPAAEYDLALFGATNELPDPLEERIAHDHLISYKTFSRAGVSATVFGPANLNESQSDELVAAAGMPQIVGTARVIRTAEGLRLDGESGFDGPRLQLPCALDGRSRWIRLVLESPSASAITLLYATNEGQEYATRRALEPGENVILVSFTDAQARGQVGVHLEHRSGDYLIRSIRVSKESIFK